MHHSSPSTVYTTAFVKPVVVHWLEREIGVTISMTHRSVSGCSTTELRRALQACCSGHTHQRFGLSSTVRELFVCLFVVGVLLLLFFIYLFCFVLFLFLLIFIFWGFGLCVFGGILGVIFEAVTEV